MADDPIVDDVVSTYLTLVDAEIPGLVEGLYLVGSVALGDFRAGVSDIDYVAVTANRPDASVTAALDRAHRGLRRARRRPAFDGTYVTWADLALDPALAPVGPGTHEGRFSPERGGRDPVIWHTLARHGTTYRGPVPTDVDIWTDPDRLAAWTDDNLDRYWQPLLDRSSRLVSRSGLFATVPYGTVWYVTGVARLHYTLTIGAITSKTGAARYALDTFDQRWHRVLLESIRIRTQRGGRSRYRTPLQRRHDVLGFGRMVVNDAHRVYADRR